MTLFEKAYMCWHICVVHNNILQQAVGLCLLILYNLTIEALVKLSGFVSLFPLELMNVILCKYREN